MRTNLPRSHKVCLPALLAAVLLPCLVRAQPVTFGVMGGIPVAPDSQNQGQGCFDRGPLICGANDLTVKPYALGLHVEFHLPWHFSTATGFLYERYHLDLAQGLTAPHGGPVNFSEAYSAAANAWLFPFLLKYTLEPRKIAPFVEAGATLRHLGAFEGQGIQLDYYLQPQPISIHIESLRDWHAAFTAGAGLRWRMSMIDLTSEIRLMHWATLDDQPVQNQVMLMVGFTFPARR